MKKKALIASSAALATFLLPLVSFAAINNISDAGSFIINLINNVVVPVIFALAFIVFLIGAFQAFILGASNGDEAKKKGKSLMLWSLVGFFVMISIWGLVNLLTNSVQFGNNSAPTTIPTTGVQVH